MRGNGGASKSPDAQCSQSLLRPDCLFVELTSLDELSFPTSSSARIKYVSVCASPRHLAVGASSGSVYLFSRFASKYRKGGGVPVQVIATRDGAATLMEMSPDEAYLAIASAGGSVHLIDLKGGVLSSASAAGGPPLLARTNAIHRGAQVTALAWSQCAAVLYAGDSGGRVSETRLTTRVFRSASDLLFETTGAVVQLDVRDNLLLISTTARCCIYDLEGQCSTAVGRKTRQGVYGACFLPVPPALPPHDVHSETERGRPSTRPVIFAARPSGRLWEVDAGGTVYSTHQFGAVAALPVAPVLSYRYQVDMDELSGDQSACAIPFSRLHVIETGHSECPALLSISDDTLYVVDPKSARVLLVCVSDQSMTHYSVCKGDVFLLSECGGLRKFSLLAVHEAVEQLHAKQLLAQAAHVAAWYAPAVAHIGWSYELLSSLCAYVAERRDELGESERAADGRGLHTLRLLRAAARAAADKCTMHRMHRHRRTFDCKHPVGVAVRRVLACVPSTRTSCYDDDVPLAAHGRSKRARSVTSVFRERGTRVDTADWDDEQAHLSDSVVESLGRASLLKRHSVTRVSPVSCAAESWSRRVPHAPVPMSMAPDDHESLHTLLAGAVDAPPLRHVDNANDARVHSGTGAQFERSLLDLGITTPISAVDVATLLSNTTLALPQWPRSGRVVTPPSAPLVLYDALELSNTPSGKVSSDRAAAALPPMPSVPEVLRGRGRRKARPADKAHGRREAARSGDSRSPASGRPSPITVDELNNSVSRLDTVSVPGGDAVNENTDSSGTASSTPAAGDKPDAYTRAMRILRKARRSRDNSASDGGGAGIAKVAASVGDKVQSTRLNQLVDGTVPPQPGANMHRDARPDYCPKCYLHRSWPLAIQLSPLVRRVPVDAEQYCLGGVPATETQWLDFLSRHAAAHAVGKCDGRMSAADDKADGGDGRRTAASASACPCLACQRLLHANVPAEPYTSRLDAVPCTSDGTKAGSSEALVQEILAELDDRDMLAVFGTMHTKARVHNAHGDGVDAPVHCDKQTQQVDRCAEAQSSCELAYSTYSNPAYSSCHDGHTGEQWSAPPQCDATRSAAAALGLPLPCVLDACAAVVGCDALLRIVEAAGATACNACPQLWRTVAGHVLHEGRMRHAHVLPPQLISTLVRDLCDSRVLCTSDGLAARLNALPASEVGGADCARRTFTIDASKPCEQCGLPLNKLLLRNDTGDGANATDATVDVRVFPACGHAVHALCALNPMETAGRASCPKCTSSV